jgi:hypothetical protein
VLRKPYPRQVLPFTMPRLAQSPPFRPAHPSNAFAFFRSGASNLLVSMQWDAPSKEDLGWRSRLSRAGVAF